MEKPIDLPAGDERREALKRAYDELEEQAERVAAELGIERPRADALKRAPLDESLRPHDPDLKIQHPDKNYRYCWVYRDPFNKYGGRTVHAYQAEGWEVVTGDMAEGKGMRIGAENTVVNADCLLMRMRIDAHLLRSARDKDRRMHVQEGIAASFEESADRRGMKAHVDLPDSVKSAIEGSSATRMTSRRAKQQFARQMATSKLDSLIRSGNVPGVPAPGHGR